MCGGCALFCGSDGVVVGKGFVVRMSPTNCNAVM